MALISAELKAAASSAMGEVFNAFKRDTQLTFYKAEKKTVVMEDPNFISGFKKLDQSGNTVTIEAQSQSFDARIWYLDQQNLANSFNEQIGVKAKSAWGQIKIQLEEDGFNYLEGTKKIKFLDEEYFVDDDVRRIGILSELKYFMFILRRDN